MAVPRCVQEYADYGYKLFHIPRPTRRGGGIGILVKDNISIGRNKIHHLGHTRLEVHLQMFIALCLIFKNLIHGEKEQFFRTVGGIRRNYLALVTLCWGAERRHYFLSMMTL